MSSILDKPAIRKAALPITVEQYHRLGEAGIIAENTELVRGIILEKMNKSPRHTWIVQWLVEELRQGVGQEFHVRQEQPITLADSEPEPDIAVVQGHPEDFRSTHPATAVLVVEVALSTVEIDREKAEIYAAAGVTEYWLVLPEERIVEKYVGPSAAGYAEIQRISGGAIIFPQCVPELKVDLARLFA